MKGRAGPGHQIKGYSGVCVFMQPPNKATLYHLYFVPPLEAREAQS